MAAKKEFLKICHKVYKNKFVSAYDGNISLKIDSNKFIVTPSGVCKGDLKKKDLLIVDLDGNILEGNGKVTTEWKMHRFVYLKRPKINCVIHCHPPFATAFAIAQKKLNILTSAEAILLLGNVPLCDYFTPSTEEVYQSLEPYIFESEVFLLANHGALAIGKSLSETYYKMEKLESYAKILFIAQTLGGEKNIEAEKIKYLLSISEQTYGIKPKISYE